jgi:plasmid stabilization system protein ParE
MKLVWSKLAADELSAILDHMMQDHPDIAANIAASVLRHEQIMTTFPRAASYDAQTNTYDCYVPRTRLVLTYKIDDDLITIVSVWHTSRNPDDKP